ncbi:hypothetical protein N3Z16_10420 (plasmid) [Candidatus Megaera polyxenophila]|uniref:hypothetical protein n=1 Tax=Candidatus Megaera polyxenophila TaxID=988779 RepID=UPI00249F6962|nr:hypothetical protein N3Z16_10420 [Candidatus Megaera polyxenophila]
MLNQKGFKVDEEDMARVLPLSTKNTLVHGQYSFRKVEVFNLFWVYSPPLAA